jgi:hypothetical protein
VSVFKSETVIPISVTDLGPVAQELAEHFKQRSYQVECTETSDRKWEVGITRGGKFKSIAGLKSAMKIELEPLPRGTMVRAGAGLFGKQAAVTAVTVVIWWPLAIAPIWGMIREAGLDNEAVRVIEVSLKRAQRLGDLSTGDVTSRVGSSGNGVAGPAEPQQRTQPVPSAPAAEPTGPTATTAAAGRSAPSSVSAFCTDCGTQVEASAQFCGNCGHPRAV